MKIVIIDYSLGNLRSVKNAFLKFSDNVVVSSNHQDIMDADIAILPGVGAFHEAMINIKKLNLDNAIHKYINSGKMFIGICLGYQLLFTESHEFYHTEGLNIIPGTVNKLPTYLNGKNMKVPHISWNKINFTKINEAVFKDIKNESFMYFVHSYYVLPSNQSDILSKTYFGDFEFCSAIRKNNVYGFQFHPEKSGEIGLKIYANIINIVKGDKK